MLRYILLVTFITKCSASPFRGRVFELNDKGQVEQPTAQYHTFPEKDGQLKDVICKSSCKYLMENGHLWSKDNAFLRKLCKATVDAYSPQCMPEALGMENGDIPDSSITASSSYESVYRPEQGRLNFEGNGKNKNPAWEPLEAQPGEWIQVDLKDEMKVTAVATQGNGKRTLKEWTTSYSLQYSNDGHYFEDYDGGRVFTGNDDRDTVVKNRIDPPIIARYIRLIPKTWNEWNALRMELYGCTLDMLGNLRSLNETCTERPLGMERGTILDSSITASSFYHNKDYPHEARLNNRYKNRLSTGVWFVVNYHDQLGSWIQVDLSNVTIVSGIASQGRPNNPPNWHAYTKRYKLAYSDNGQVFTEYLNGMVIDGNSDRDTVVKHDLVPVIRARYIRVYPQTWYGYVAMRLELYGCRKGNGLRQESVIPDNDQKQDAMSSMKPIPTTTKPDEGSSWRQSRIPLSRCSRSMCGGKR